MSRYNEIIQAIKNECARITLTYSAVGDGRLASAVKEPEYLAALQHGLAERHPTFKVELQPVERWWWDVRIEGITINLKLTTGGTDNAFNKVAIIYTITGKEVEKRNMNPNQFYQTLQSTPHKSIRDPMTEYHYLVVHKTTGQFLLKSLLDIHTYKSNPCNDLQINWANEFRHIEYVTPDFQEKIKDVLRTYQTSIRQLMAGMNELANAVL